MVPRCTGERWNGVVEMIEGIKFWFSRDLYNLIVLFAVLIAVGILILIVSVIDRIVQKRKERRDKDDT